VMMCKVTMRSIMVMGIQTSIRPISITEFRPLMELLNKSKRQKQCKQQHRIHDKKELQPDRKQ
jgi:hypothetical protein